MIPDARSINFILFSVAQCASFTGSWAQKTAIGWLAWDITHSPAWVGAIALSDLIAALGVGPFAGAVTDRNNPYRLILSTQTMTMLSCVAIWLVVVSDTVSPWLLLGWAVVESTLQGFNHPARMLVIGSLAPEGRLSQAIATNSIAVNIARAAGPAIAAALIVKMGIETVFLFTILSFGFMFAAVFRVRLWIDRPPVGGRSSSLPGDAAAGFQYVRSDPQIAMLFVLTIFFALFARPFTELFPALAGGAFDGGPQMLGMLMSAQGIGALAGACWMLRRQTVPALVRTSYLAALGIAVALTMFALTDSALIALPTIALAGLFHVVCNISMQSLAQTLSVASMRGRVLALYTLIFRAGPALGAFSLGSMAQWFDLQLLIGIAAVSFALLVLLLLPSARRIYGGL